MSGASATESDVLELVSELTGHRVTDDDLDVGWLELGVDSFASTEFLIRLEDMMTDIDPRPIEAALFTSATIGEFLNRLADMGGVR